MLAYQHEAHPHLITICVVLGVLQAYSTTIVVGLYHLKQAVFLQVHLRYLKNQKIATALFMHLTTTIVWAHRLARLCKLYCEKSWQSQFWSL